MYFVRHTYRVEFARVFAYLVSNSNNRDVINIKIEVY